MRALLLVVTVIFALNVAYAAFLVVSELVHRWRARREVGALEAMWFADRQEASGHARRSVGRIVLAGASLLLVSGLTVASPVGSVARNVVDHVTEAISRLGGPGGEPGVVAAPSEAAATESPSLAPSVGPRTSTDPSQDGRDPNEDDSGTERTATDPSQREGSPDASADGPTDVGSPADTSTPTDDPEPTQTDEPSSSPTVAPTPFVVEAELLSPTAVKLSWERYQSATRYDVEIFDTGQGVWTGLESLPAGKLSLVVDDREPGVTYDFRVTVSLAQGEPVTDDVTVPMPPA